MLRKLARLIIQDELMQRDTEIALLKGQKTLAECERTLWRSRSIYADRPSSDVLILTHPKG